MRLQEQASRLLLPVGGLLAVALTVAGGPAQHWIAAAIALTLVPRVVAQLPDEAGEWVRRTAPLGLLFMLTFLTLGELALGRMPASRDHSIHYFQTAILVDELIPTGRLIGWSERLNNGYPFGDSYPVLGYLWVAAGHLVTGKLLPLRASYALGLLGVWLLSLWGVYRVAELIWHEVRPASPTGASPDTSPDTSRSHRLAACLGAAAWLLDAGGSRQGGWEYNMFHGVWPQLLSTGLWMAGLVWTWRAFRGPSLRRWAMGAMCMGGAIMAHPFGLLAVAGTAAAWPLLLLTNGSLRELPPGAGRTWALIHVTAVGLAAGWLVPFLASADSMGRSPVPWAPLGVLATDLLRGQLFHGDYLGFVAPLGLLGGLVALARATTFGRLVVVLVLGMLIAGSEEAITVLRLDLLLSAFKNLQFPRYSIVLKPLWFALSGIGGAMLAETVVQALRPRLKRLTSERVVVAMVVAPLLAATVGGLGRLMPRPVGAVDTLQESDAGEVDRQLLAALASEQAALNDVPMRVAFLRVGMSGATYPLVAVADVGATAILEGHIPSVNIEHRISQRSPPVLAALGVTHVLYDRNLRKKEQPLKDSLEEVGRYGRVRLARFVPRADPLAPVRLDQGRGEVSMELDTPEHKILRVTELKARTQGARLQLLLAPYWRWQATVDGEPLELNESAVLGNSLHGTQTLIEHNGAVELTYSRPVHERRAAWLSGALGLLCLAGLMGGREIAMAARIHPPAAVRAAWALGALVVLSAGVGAHRRQSRLLERSWTDVHTPRDPGETFVRDLVDDGAFTTWWTPDQLCEGLYGKNARSGCSSAEYAPRKSMTYHDPYLFRCVRLMIPPNGYARVFFRPEADESVVGFVRRAEQSGSGKSLWWRVGTDHKAEVLGNGRHAFAVPAGTTDEVSVRFSNNTPRPEPICVAAGTFR